MRKLKVTFYIQQGHILNQQGKRNKLYISTKYLNENWIYVLVKTEWMAKQSMVKMRLSLFMPCNSAKSKKLDKTRVLSSGNKPHAWRKELRQTCHNLCWYRNRGNGTVKAKNEKMDRIKVGCEFLLNISNSAHSHFSIFKQLLFLRKGVVDGWRWIGLKMYSQNIIFRRFFPIKQKSEK